MDRALRNRVANTAGREHDLADRGVFHDHRDDDVPPFAGFANRVRHARGGCGESAHGRRRDVEDSQIVAAAEKTFGHAPTHATEADESNLHTVTAWGVR